MKHGGRIEFIMAVLMIYFLSIIVRNATTRSEAINMALGRYLLIVFWKCYSVPYTVNWYEQM